MNSDVVSNWKKQLPSTMENYDPSEMFNMDKTGCSSRIVKSQPFSRKRKLVQMASMTEEKFTKIVIGKLKRPRCFS